MPSGAKRPGSPLEGKTTKFLIAEQVDGQAPSQRVAHPRKLTKVSTSGAKAADSITIQFANISLKEGPPNANAPDFLRGVDTSVKAVDAQIAGLFPGTSASLEKSSGAHDANVSISGDHGNGHNASPWRPITRQPVDQELSIVTGCVPVPVPVNLPAFNDATVGQIPHHRSTPASGDVAIPDPEVIGGRSNQGAAWSPSSGLSYVTDYGHTAHCVGNETPPSHATPNVGSVSLPPGENPLQSLSTVQATAAGTQPPASNDNIGLPANGLPISRRPTVISITSSEHSQRQRRSLSRKSSARAEGNSQFIPNVCDSPILSTLVKQASRSFPPALGKAACGLDGRWTRGTFIIGRSAPVKIDEEIEVHLRASASGEVDFVIA